ncbi:MAG: efflux RND transporter periplasmic adaptor subunit, partial [Pseudomonadota bacterium]|nr:efflux RND transporter periplasmic adaptor subunit [Pseudomonadota bacterium]
ASARLVQLGARPGAAPVLAVRAPIAGRVVELVATAGGYWTDATAPLLTLADLGHVYVTASAQEKDLAQLREGQDVSVAFDAWPDPVRARVGMLDWMVDPDTRTLKVRIPLDNRAARLRPGMFARVSFVAPPRKGLMVPAAAVVQVGLAARVFVEVAPWQFTPRTVTLGAQAGNQVEVLSGLVPGDRIVVKDGVLLND